MSQLQLSTAVLRRCPAGLCASLSRSFTKGQAPGNTIAHSSDSDSSDDDLTSSPSIIKSRIDPSMEVDPPATGGFKSCADLTIARPLLRHSHPLYPSSVTFTLSISPPSLSPSLSLLRHSHPLTFSFHFFPGHVSSFHLLPIVQCSPRLLHYPFPTQCSPVCDDRSPSLSDTSLLPPSCLLFHSTSTFSLLELQTLMPLLLWTRRRGIQ